MPFDGSGNFVALSLPDFPAIGGQPIYASQFNNVVTDLINGLSSVMARDGSTSMVGALQMGGNKITGVDNGTQAGDALAWGQAGATLDDLVVAHALQAEYLGINKAGAEALVSVARTSFATANFGVSGPSGASSVGTPAGGIFLGSPNNVPLYFGLNGATRAMLEPGGTFSASIFGGSGIIAGNPADTFSHLGQGVNHYCLRWLTFSDNASSQAILSAYGGLKFATGGVVRMQIDASGNIVGNFVGSLVGSISGSAASAPWSGITGKPTTLSGLGMTNDLVVAGVTSFNGRTGTVSLTSGDVTGAIGGTPLFSISSGMIVAALGFTPYSAANPNSYITGISSGMITTALGFTPYSNANPSNFVTAIANVDDFVGTDLGNGYDLTNCTLSKAGTTITLTRRKVYRAAVDPGGGGP